MEAKTNFFFNHAKNFQHKKRKIEQPENSPHSHQHKRKFLTRNDGTKSHNELMQEVRQLPIFFGKGALLQEIATHETVIVMSETGSGKTTQLPQYILNQYSSKGIVCCTQPRRVAAITVAARVAKEKNCKLGELVGYTVRFEDVTSAHTKLKYMTDGMLLREALLDPLLKRYSVVILDEAHERSVQTDVLFGVVKKAQETRRATGRPLKIIIMSATLQAEEFVKYFNNAKICFLEGRRHPIKIMYTEEIQKDYAHASLVAALQLHKQTPPGHDVLVFLTGQEEILSTAKVVNEISTFLKEDYGNLAICPLFASLPHAQQLVAFEAAAPGCRKIILATNIAETSVTIPNVKYVIDCGMVKIKEYNPTTGMETLKVRPISKAQARQRCGRAGRECPGVCYRLYPEEAFHMLEENTVPEIKRCNLRSVALNLLAMGLPDIVTFDFMSPPSQNALKDALQQLVLLEAVESVETQRITEKGRLMSSFPLDPALSRCILAAQENECIEDMISIISILSVDSLIYIPPTERERGRRILQKFYASEGDQISMLHILKEYKKMKGNPEWCRDNFVDVKNMKTVRQIRHQLRDLCTRSSMSMKNVRHEQYKGLRRSLCAGLFFNSAERQMDGTYVTLMQKLPVNIHPSSVLFNQKPSFVVFNELVETSKRYMRALCVVDPLWLIDACPSRFENCKLLPETVVS